MKTVRIVTNPVGSPHGRNVRIFDDQGNDLSGLIRRAEITLDANAVNTVCLEAFPGVQIDALVEGVRILERKCLHCDGTSIVETTSFGMPVKTFARGGQAATIK